LQDVWLTTTAHIVTNISEGTLDVTRGGTGATNFTGGRLLIGNGTNPITENGNLTWLTASNTLNITGDINITGTYKKNNNTIVSSQWITSGTTTEYNAGSVGIGTPALTYKLNVNGTTQTTSLTTTNLGIGITNPAIPLHIYNCSNSRILLDTTTTGTVSIEFRRGTGFDIQQDFRFINDTDSTLILQICWKCRNRNFTKYYSNNKIKYNRRHDNNWEHWCW
jgi:hypothetical protein